MEFQQNPAPQEGAPTEPAPKTSGQWREEFRMELELLAKEGVVQSHVRNSLRSLRAALRHLGNCPEFEFKAGLPPASATATRAALELIRIELRSVERQVLRAELVFLRQQSDRYEQRLDGRDEEQAW